MLTVVAAVPAISWLEHCQSPHLFQPHEIERDFRVYVVNGGDGNYNGVETPTTEVRAVVGPIYELLGTISGQVCVNRGQGAGGYEAQWLTAVFRQDVRRWTVDHPGN